MAGAGLTVMVNVRAGPSQPPMTGVTVMVPTCCVAGLAVAKEMLPEPEPGKPIFGLLLVHSKSAPADPAKLMEMVEPPQAMAGAGCPMAGMGDTEMVNISGVPMQPPSAGVTVMVAVWVPAGLAAVKLMFPKPVAPSPMAVLLLVQE